MKESELSNTLIGTRAVGAQKGEKMKKMLPINEHPMIRSYSSHMYFELICHLESTCSDVVARMNIRDYDKSDWTVHTHNAQYVVENDTVITKTDPYIEGVELYLFRELHLQDELTVDILTQTYFNPWSSLGVFVCKQNYDDVVFYFGLNCTRGLFFEDQHSFKDHFIANLQNRPKQLTITRQEDKLNLYFGDLCMEQIDSGSFNGYQIGIFVRSPSNQYFNWLYSNFTQLYMPTNVQRPLDWYRGPLRDHRNFHNNPLLLYNRTYFYPHTIVNELMKFIDDHKYIEIYLNEYYGCKSLAYLSFEYYHDNLFFGYDTEDEVFYVINNYMGIPTVSTISFSDVVLSYKEANNKIAYLIYYQPDETVYEFDIQFFIEATEEYLNGINTSKKYAAMSNPSTGIFGVKIYEELVKPEWMERIASDLRISYMLYEHSVIMYERLKFLFVRKYINQNTYESLQKQYQIFKEKCQYIVNILIKNRHKPYNDANTKMIQLINEIKNMDIALNKELLCQLNRNYPMISD
ncbi:MAG: hypothetical protein LBM69_09660 [Lachnospiraceae bacterium]|nr:hypothetical protein [Lachnospiraceae bacterium]